MSAPIEMPLSRRNALGGILAALADARSIVLTTHVNADGDGAGSEAAVAAWLRSIGKRCAIVNPTPFPNTYRFLLTDPEIVVAVGDDGAEQVLEPADLILVLDTAEPSRLGRLPKAFRDKRVAVIDHHPPSPTTLQGMVLQDPTACATGELVFDLLQIAIGHDVAWPAEAVRGVYTAIVTDTGSFRFSNTSSRAHRIAAELIQRGVVPEELYRKLFGAVPLRRIQILRAALETLTVDDELPLAWISIPAEVTRNQNPTAEDVEGIVEYARSIEGTEVAILFRETAGGGTKVSFRSNGDVDVNALAREFGGGGHIKASGAVVGAPLGAAQRQVLAAARRMLRSASFDGRA